MCCFKRGASLLSDPLSVMDDIPYDRHAFHLHSHFTRLGDWTELGWLDYHGVGIIYM